MAEIIAPQKGGKRKVQAPRIDFTPMVDLGFILITFFIFTTTLAKPNTMEVNMPSNEHTDKPTAFIEESTITLIPVKNHNVVYYNGSLTGTEKLNVQTVGLIRDILLSKKKEVAALPAKFSPEAHKLHVLIKPNDDCKYDDVVQLLDDMNIVDAPYYALVDITAEDKEMVSAYLNSEIRK